MEKLQKILCTQFFFLGAGFEPAFSLSVLWRHQKPLAYQFAYPRLWTVGLEPTSADFQSAAIDHLCYIHKSKIAPDVFSADPCIRHSLSRRLKLLSQPSGYLILVNVHFRRPYNKKGHFAYCSLSKHTLLAISHALRWMFSSAILWAGKDSNLRRELTQRIYSPPFLTTRPPTRN